MNKLNVYYWIIPTKRLVRLAPFAMSKKAAELAALDFVSRNVNNPRYSEPFVASH